jgi:hypothetical protein
MKKLILSLTVLLSLSAFATSAKPRIIATYTDLYNDDDLVSQCLIFSDGTGMKLFDGLVPFNKPEELKISTEVFKNINEALDLESLGGIDKETRRCNESVPPMKVMGKAFNKNKGAYVTGESRNLFYKEQPACWTRQNQDHVVLGTHSKVAGILKELCGFKDLELDQ